MADDPLVPTAVIDAAMTCAPGKRLVHLVAVARGEEEWVTERWVRADVSSMLWAGLVAWQHLLGSRADLSSDSLDSAPDA